MQTISSSLVRADLRSILDEVVRGEVITITRHGVAVAAIVPLQAGSQRLISPGDQIKVARLFAQLAYLSAMQMPR